MITVRRDEMTVEGRQRAVDRLSAVLASTQVPSFLPVYRTFVLLEQTTSGKRSVAQAATHARVHPPHVSVHVHDEFAADFARGRGRAAISLQITRMSRINSTTLK
jgi:hypothetical protein